MHESHLAVRRGYRIAIISGLLAAGTVGVVGFAIADPGGTDQPAPAARALYVDPNSEAAVWVGEHPNDERTGVISKRIAAVPQGTWFTEYNPNTITADVKDYVGRADAAGQVPVLVPYAIPDRDCGGASEGGAPDIASYKTWLDKFAAGLSDKEAIVIVEPDAIALSDCLNEQQKAARNDALSYAGKTIHAKNSNAKVYYDAGHSNWHPAAEMTDLLIAAGVKENGDGIYTNVSNYNTTTDEVNYGAQILDALKTPKLTQVIDTSRNGNGPGDTWCDPAGRKIGEYPTLNTGIARVSAFLWVKLVGEADGCIAAAGTFVPEQAYAMVKDAEDPGPQPTNAPTSSPTGTARSSVTPTSELPTKPEPTFVPEPTTPGPTVIPTSPPTGGDPTGTVGPVPPAHTETPRAPSTASPAPMPTSSPVSRAVELPPDTHVSSRGNTLAVTGRPLIPVIAVAAGLLVFGIVLRFYGRRLQPPAS